MIWFVVVLGPFKPAVTCYISSFEEYKAKNGASQMVDLLGLEVFALLVLATIVTAFETGAIVANTSRAKMVTEITKCPLWAME